MYTSKIPGPGVGRRREAEFLFWGNLLVATKAGEGELVLGVDGSGTVATSAAGVASIAAVAATLTTASTTSASATAAATTGGAVALNVARVEFEGLLDLALTLTLFLAVVASDEFFVIILLESLGVGPLLVELATLVGLADLEFSFESGLLLGLLSEVVGKGDALVLGFGGLLDGAFLGRSILLF